MSKALELAKFGRESAPDGVVVGDSDAQTLSQKTFSDGPVFSGLNANAIPYLNASKVLSTTSNFIFDGTNFGLGISSPAYKLDVRGQDARLSSGTAGSYAIFRVGGASSDSIWGYAGANNDVATGSTAGDTVFGSNKASANLHLLSGNGAIAVTIDASKNIGIGTTPNSNGRLTVYETTVAKLYLTDSTLGTGYGGQVRGYGTTGAGGYLELGVIDANTYNSAVKVFNQATQISLYTNSGTNGSTTERVRIDNNGNVFIGANTGSGKLNVTTTSGAAASFSAPSGTTQQNSVQFVNSTNSSYIAIAGAGTSSVVGSWINGSQIIEFVPYSTGDSIISAYTGNLTFQTNARTERMRIEGAGNVRFGSTGTTDRPVHLTGSGTRQYFKAETTTNSISNEAGFDIKTPNSNYIIGSHGSTNALWIYDMNSAAERLRIDSTGRLLVGSTSGRGGSTTQHIFRIPTGSSYLEIQQASTSGTTDILFTDGTSGNYGIIGYEHSTDALRMYTASGERMRITSEGYVGIATTDPQSLLTINSGGTDSLAGATINQSTDFAATSRAGFSGLTNNNGGFYFGMGANGTGIPAGFGFFREASGWNTALAFYTNNQTSGSYSTRAMQEKMRLNSAGDLNILTTTVGGTNSQALPGSLLFTGSGWNTLQGTKPMGAGISLVGNYGALNGGSTEPSLIFSLYGTGSGGYNTTAGPTSLTERMRINNYGNVGINTTTPQEKLDVNGNIKFGANSGLICTAWGWTGTAINLCSYNTGTGGTSMLVMIHGHGDVAQAHHAMYYVSIHYNGTLNSATLVSGSTFSFDVSGGYLRVTSGNQNWSYSATILRNDIN